MASCLVPDSPAVMVALEHIKELDKQLKEDRVPFSNEASLHLSEITAAVTELEGDRSATHEHLEVETIENSKLRHQINNTNERISQEIMADVAAARASNADEIKQLHQDLHKVIQQQGRTVKRQEALLSQNEALHPEREQVKAEHEDIIAALNDQITFKYCLQTKLDQTLEHIEELKSSIAAVEQDTITVQQNMTLEREAFSIKKESLAKEEIETEEKITEQKETVSRCRNDLDRVNYKSLESNAHFGELTIELAKLERNIRRLTDSQCQYRKQLVEETQTHQGLKQERETLTKKLSEIKDEFRVKIQQLKEEITIAEGKIVEGHTQRVRCQDSLAKVLEIFEWQQDEENEVKTEYLLASQQLEQSRLQLEERIASIVKHSKEINEMDKQIRDLSDECTINKRVFERNQEEICGNVDTEKKNIGCLEEEKRTLKKLMVEVKRKQEEHVQKMENDISSTRKRYEELQEEMAILHQRQPQSVDENLMIKYTEHCEVEYQQKEAKLRQEIEQCIAGTEIHMSSNEEKQREMEENEGELEEVEGSWSEEKSRHQKLKSLTFELRRKNKYLELSIEGMKEKTRSLLQPKEEMKAELAELRASHIDVLDKQASELRAVEMSIYDNTVKVEQVSVENSRLRLCIRQMTEDVDRARGDRDRYWQEVQQYKQEMSSLFESLQDAWKEDLLATQDCQGNDGGILMSLAAMLDHIKSRRQMLGTVSTVLHQQMLNFSKRLGDKATVEQPI